MKRVFMIFVIALSLYSGYQLYTCITSAFTGVNKSLQQKISAIGEVTK